MKEERKKTNLMQGVTYSHFLLNRHIAEGDTVIDATAGNGKDTVFLAELVGNKGRVYAFDIQKIAITHTRELLEDKKLAGRVKLIQENHENMINCIDAKEVEGIIFNLGFLPGGSKDIITKTDTTLSALKDGLKILSDGGLIVIVIYTEHPGGREEKKAILDFCKELNYKKYNVLRYNFINQQSSPAQVLAIKKRL